MTLSEFFRKHPKAAIAFSGGVDSAYLLSEVIRSGADIRAYFVKTPFQPQFELDDARKLAAELNTDMTVIELNILNVPNVSENPPDRCYHCKKAMLSAIAKAAEKDGYPLLLDGTNASDSAADRPGMIALKELSFRSPLRECGLTKPEIRSLSKETGLFTWNKPAYACLATRIPCGEVITAEKLARTEAAENALSSMGFSDFRARMQGDNALLQFTEAQREAALAQQEDIFTELRKYYSDITIDSEVRK